jgi:hypothetical protein
MKNSTVSVISVPATVTRVDGTAGVVQCSTLETATGRRIGWSGKPVVSDEPCSRFLSTADARSFAASRGLVVQ